MRITYEMHKGTCLMMSAVDPRRKTVPRVPDFRVPPDGVGNFEAKRSKPLPGGRTERSEAKESVLTRWTPNVSKVARGSPWRDDDQNIV